MFFVFATKELLLRASERASEREANGKTHALRKKKGKVAHSLSKSPLLLSTFLQTNNNLYSPPKPMHTYFTTR
jgi:hypothetical protein